MLSEHSKIIASAAKKVFFPLGLKQKGRSRLWIDDHGFWLILVEFQPHFGGKGTYLNIGCMWLLYPYEYFAFDVGYREADFVEFVDSEQFLEQVLQLCEQALKSVLHYREQFSDIKKIQKYLVDHQNKISIWQVYYLAVFSALVKDFVQAKTSFDFILQQKWTLPYEHEVQHLAQELKDRLFGSYGEFVKRINTMINLSRKNLKLRAIDGGKFFE